MYRILIVGSSAFCRQIKASDAILKWNAQIDCMKRGELERTLRSDRTVYWDLMIADFESFDENAAELLQTIKNEKICFSSIVVDTELTADKMKQALMLGASDYLLKPLDDAVFQDAMKRCLACADALDRTNKISFVEQALIAAVSNGDIKTVQMKLPLYYNQVCRFCNERMLNMEHTLMKTSSQVYCEVLKQHPWIDKFICDYNVFKEKFLSSCNRQELFTVFESYLRQITDTVHVLYNLSDNPMIRKVCLYILEHSDVRISLSTVAQHCFLNKTYLSHTFKMETEISFVDYITLVKMARAKILFLESSKKVFEISSMLGFSDTGYFCKIFKKTQGITPNQYKAKVKLSRTDFSPEEKSTGLLGPKFCSGLSDHADIFSA